MDPNTEPHYGTCALLTIDVQEDFVHGSAPVPGTAEVLPNVASVLEAFRMAARPVVHVIRLYAPGGDDVDLARRTLIGSGVSVVAPGSAGSELAGELGTESRLAPQQLLAGGFQELSPQEHVMFKPRWNAFYRTGLSERLAALAVDTVVVVGCNFPNCPRATLLGASERDFRAVLVTDAVSGWDERAAGDLAGIGVATTVTSEVVRHLSRAG